LDQVLSVSSTLSDPGMTTMQRLKLRKVSLDQASIGGFQRFSNKSDQIQRPSFMGPDHTL
jgi:hypothetical protein